MIQPDSNPLHLLPAFEELVDATLLEANRETAGKFQNFSHWGMFEGYRSIARQEALYDQGRSEPGNIVTNTPIPGYHGWGYAADIVWYDHSGNPRWDGDDKMWQILGHCARMQKLIWGGDWASFPDKPHIQCNPEQHVIWKPLAEIYLKSIGLTHP